MRYCISYKQPCDNMDKPKLTMTVTAKDRDQAMGMLRKRWPNAEQVVIELIGEFPEHPIPSPPPPHECPTHPSGSGPHSEQIMERADVHLTDNHVVVCFDKLEQIYLSAKFARELSRRLMAAATDLDPHGSSD